MQKKITLALIAISLLAVGVVYANNDEPPCEQPPTCELPTQLDSLTGECILPTELQNEYEVDW